MVAEIGLADYLESVLGGRRIGYQGSAHPFPVLKGPSGGYVDFLLFGDGSVSYGVIAFHSQRGELFVAVARKGKEAGF